MKKNITILFLSIFAVGMLNAQNNRPGFERYLEKYKSEKISFLTEKLDLSVEEAEKFWPRYNKYQNERDEIIKTKSFGNRGKGPKNLSKEQMETMVDNKVEQELKLAELKMGFHKDVKKIIPIEKVVLLYRSEHDFMNHMLNKIREKGDGRRGRGSNPNR